MKRALALAGLAVAGSALASLAVPMAATAAETMVTVTPGNQQGFTTADTRPGGFVDFVVDATAPSGSGALQLTTDATTTAKAQYMHEASVPVGDLDELSYYTKQNSASFIGGDASYQLTVQLNGTSGFTTLVYEPYQNGVVIPGMWQSWDVDEGMFWSTRTVECANGGVTAGGGGAPFYTLDQIEQSCPDAVVVGFGVNIGTFNPSYDIEVDLVDFHGTLYDYEPRPANKDDCKNRGWQAFESPAFENQGDCVSFVASAGRTQH
jgi:hypothetical protein